MNYMMVLKEYRLDTLNGIGGILHLNLLNAVDSPERDRSRYDKL